MKYHAIPAMKMKYAASTPQEKGIQNRMLNGFGTWNAGFDTWKAWGKVLYSPESIYVVQGVRLTLEEYQRSMDMALKGTTMELGQFENMIISGDWTAIRYTSRNINRQTGEGGDTAVMEFVHFKDYGELGMKVETGWGGEKGRGYSAFLPYQTNLHHTHFSNLLSFSPIDLRDSFSFMSPINGTM